MEAAGIWFDEGSASRWSGFMIYRIGYLLLEVWI
jgi:hypothetical protein